MRSSNVIAIPKKSLFVPAAYGELTVSYKFQRFFVNDGNTEYMLEETFLPPFLKNITPEQIMAFLETGYLSINKSNDQFLLRAHTRGPGGGPIAGFIGYWLTKAVCYGTAAAAAGSVIVATGGVAGAVTGGAAAAILPAATAGTGAGIAAGAIVGAGLTAEAVTASTAFVAASGGVVGAVAAVEATAAGVGAVLTAIPFLP